MATSEPKGFSYQSMGTSWAMTIWDEMSETALADLERQVVADSHAFDRSFSRFNKESVIWSLTEKTGVVEVPEDLVSMLRLYEKLYVLSSGHCNPLIGYALSDLGYDAEYTLKPKDVIRPVPAFPEAVRIVDDTHLELFQSVLIDVGALGKGYFVDKLAAFFRSKGLRRFLVNGSGDVVHSGDGATIRAGLEHPGDPTKVIGVVELGDGALCGSAGNRRRWDKYHHTINPLTLTSPEEIIATWVMAPTATVADGLATCMFLVEPERFEKDFEFGYCLLNKDFRVKRSPNFVAELF